MKISIERKYILGDSDESVNVSHDSNEYIYESLDYETIRDYFRKQPDPVYVESLDVHSYLLRVYSAFPDIVGLRIENDDPNQTLIIPPFINQFTTIENLYLVGKVSFPPEIWGLSNLRTLDISNNNLQSLPAELGNLVNLQTLKVQNNELKKVCPEIGRLRNLTLLSFPSNRLAELPDEIGKLEKLQKLFLSDNNLSTLPAAMVELINLQELQLANNNFKYFPDVIGHFIGLELLDISNNIQQPRNRSSNRLTELPSAIGRLTKLSKFNLSGNKLTGLPVEFKRLAQLSELDLSGNQLAVLPPEVCDLGALKTLNLAGNVLSTLPTEIQKLGKLEALLLQNNQFLSLPSGIKELKKLRKLDVQGNGFPLLFAENNNPGWFIAGVKNLTRDKVVLQNQGRLTTQLINRLIDEIQNDSDYSEQQRSYLISFLREYDLYLDVVPKNSFFVPDAPPEFIRLEGDEWQGALAGEFYYNFLPPNLFNLLILRLAPYIHNNNVWQAGVILRKDENLALIQINIGDKKILIQVKGKHETRQNFLRIVHFEIETIHKLLDLESRGITTKFSPEEFLHDGQTLVQKLSWPETIGKFIFDIRNPANPHPLSYKIMGWIIILFIMVLFITIITISVFVMKGTTTVDAIIKWISDLYLLFHSSP